MVYPESEEPNQESSESMGMGARTRHGMFRLMSQVMRLPKTVVKEAFDRSMAAMDPEVATHLIQSNRELLLAMRSFVDREIRMADRAIDKVQQRNQPPAKETSFQPGGMTPQTGGETGLQEPDRP